MNGTNGRSSTWSGLRGGGSKQKHTPGRKNMWSVGEEAGSIIRLAGKHGPRVEYYSRVSGDLK